MTNLYVKIAVFFLKRTRRRLEQAINDTFDMQKSQLLDRLIEAEQLLRAN